MMFGKPKTTAPYLTRALEAIDAEKFPEAQQIIQDGAIDYFVRFKPAAARGMPALRYQQYQLLPWCWRGAPAWRKASGKRGSLV